MSFNGEMVKQTMIQPYRAMPLSNKKESTADTHSAAAAKSLHSCPTLCDPIAAHQAPRPWDSPGKNTGVGCHFLLQCIKVKSESEVAQSCPTRATPWTAAHQAPPSMGFSRQECWSGVTLPSPSRLLALHRTSGSGQASQSHHCRPHLPQMFPRARFAFG